MTRLVRLYTHLHKLMFECLIIVAFNSLRGTNCFASGTYLCMELSSFTFIYIIPPKSIVCRDRALLLPGAKAKTCIDFYISIEKGRPFNLVGHAVGFPWLLGMQLLVPVSTLNLNLWKIKQFWAGWRSKVRLWQQQLGLLWKRVITSPAQIPWHPNVFWAASLQALPCVPFDPVWLLHDTQRWRALTGGSQELVRLSWVAAQTWGGWFSRERKEARRSRPLMQISWG